MDFIKQMKKREFIEMGLKTLAAMLAAFLLIILMEGMIYSIKLNAIVENKTNTGSDSNSTIAYCVKEDDDKYFVIYYNEGKSTEWAATANVYLTEAECKAMEGRTAKKVYMRAPNAFELSITGTHYIIMAVFVSAVAGFFVYKFMSLSKSYKKIEDEFIKTGTISIENL